MWAAEYMEPQEYRFYYWGACFMKNYNQIGRSLAMITQLGISILAPVVLCVFIGDWLDRRFGWSVTAVLLILGILAGARNAWVLMKDVGGIASGRKKHEKDQSDSV